MSGPFASILVGVLAGAALGAIYLGLLWAAVRSLPRERGGVLVFAGLAFARVALLIAALAAAAALGLQVQGMVAALAGFILVRLAATRWLGNGTLGDAPWK